MLSFCDEQNAVFTKYFTSFITLDKMGGWLLRNRHYLHPWWQTMQRKYLEAAFKWEWKKRSRGIIFYKSLELQSNYPEKIFVKNFFFLTDSPNPHPFNDQNPLRVTNFFCRCPLKFTKNYFEWYKLKFRNHFQINNYRNCGHCVLVLFFLMAFVNQV